MLQETSEFLCCTFLLLSIVGCILYFPFKSHWSKIFSFWDVMSFCCGIMCIGVLIFCGKSMWEEMGFEAIISFILMIGVILWGLFTLIACWENCSNIIEIILLPLIMISTFGACMIVICIGVCLFFLGLKQDD